MAPVIRRRAARQDLVDIVYHYLREKTPTTARRFRNQAEATVQRLAEMPGLGSLYEHNHPALAGLRFFPVLYFPRDSPVSCGQVEQPFCGRLDFLLGHPRV
jgi:plasmid stabilization system protein ParE